MSYDIDSVETKRLDAWIDRAVFRRLSKLPHPEGSFLHNECCFAVECDRVRLLKFWWYGEGSGATYSEVLIKKIAPCIKGTVEAVFCWEGGDSMSGLIINDGMVQECDVKMTLVPKR